MRELTTNEIKEVNGGFGPAGAIIGGVLGAISGARNNGASGFVTGLVLGAASGALGGWAGTLFSAGYRSMSAVAGANSVLTGIIASEEIKDD